MGDGADEAYIVARCWFALQSTGVGGARGETALRMACRRWLGVMYTRGYYNKNMLEARVALARCERLEVRCVAALITVECCRIA